MTTANGPEGREGRTAPGPDGLTGADGPPVWKALAVPLGLNLVLPLAVFYGLRSQGVGQLTALTLSGAAPAGRVLWTLARRRTADGFDLFVIGMLAVRVVTSLLSAGPRVLLVKDASLSVAAGLWILGSLLAARPFAFQLAQYWSTPAAAEGRAAAWHTSPALRGGLTALTVMWGGAQVLDCAIGVLVALTCPVEAVPALNRGKGLALLGLVAVVTLLYSRSRARRYGVPLFGTRPPGPAAAPR